MARPGGAGEIEMSVDTWGGKSCRLNTPPVTNTNTHRPEATDATEMTAQTPYDSDGLISVCLFVVFWTNF